jgi:hypothetical protein
MIYSSYIFPHSNKQLQSSNKDRITELHSLLKNGLKKETYSVVKIFLQIYQFSDLSTNYLGAN